MLIANPASFQDRLTREIPRLRTLARSLLNDIGDADDLVQDTLEQALILGPPRDLDALAKRLEVILRSCSSDDNDHLAPFDDSARNICLTEDDLIIELDDLLERVPETHRSILRLAAQGMKYKEIARHENVPIGTVMSRLARARAQLKTAFPYKGPLSVAVYMKEPQPIDHLAPTLTQLTDATRASVRKARTPARGRGRTDKNLHHDVPDWFRRLTGEIA